MHQPVDRALARAAVERDPPAGCRPDRPDRRYPGVMRQVFAAAISALLVGGCRCNPAAEPVGPTAGGLPEPQPDPYDVDGDGWRPSDGDCDDLDPNVHPGATDLAGDGIDANCDHADVPAAWAGDLAVAAWPHPAPEPTILWERLGSSLAATDTSGDGVPDLFVSGDGDVLITGYKSGLYAMDGGGPLRDLFLGARFLRDESDDGSPTVSGINFTPVHRDLTGDGRDDLLMVTGSGFLSPDHAEGTLVAVLSAPLDDGWFADQDAAAWIVEEHELGEGAMGGVLTGPDLNDDGIDELLVMYHPSSWLEPPWSELVRYTSPHRPAMRRTDGTVLARYEGTLSADGVRDLDGDGLDEVLVSRSDGTIDRIDLDAPEVPVEAWTSEDTSNTFRSPSPESQDLDGDGLGDLVTTSWSQSTERGERAGLAFVAPGPPPAEPTDLEAVAYRFDGAGPHDAFGYAVATGDVDGDGFTDLAFGAPGPIGYLWSGRVHLHFGPIDAGAAPEEADFVVSAARPGEHFGCSLALGDFDDDGRADLAVGAPWAHRDMGYGEHGDVYLFSGDDLGW